MNLLVRIIVFEIIEYFLTTSVLWWPKPVPNLIELVDVYIIALCDKLAHLVTVEFFCNGIAYKIYSKNLFR